MSVRLLENSLSKQTVGRTIVAKTELHVWFQVFPNSRLFANEFL